MTTSLDTFFDAIWPFMERRTDVAEATRLLGPSPSGSARLALYPEFIRRQKRDLLDHFFASVRSACMTLDSTLWERVAEDYVREVAPRHWEVNHYAGPFVDFLEARQTHDAAVPEYLVELADFAWIRFLSMIAEHPESQGTALGSAFFLRHYTHEIPVYARAAERRYLRTGTLPDAVPCTVLVGRSRKAPRIVILRPSLAALVALRRREVPDAPQLLPDGISDEDVATEDAALVEKGVLLPFVTGAPVTSILR
jgi:Putative DNA-binding domain